jgi:hypothetical protein
MHPMARILLLGAAAAAATACGAREGGEAAAGGLYGTVRVQPGTPTCVAGTSCAKPAAGFRLVFLREGRRIAAATTDVRGRYRVRLAAGRYVVRAAEGVSPKRGLQPGTVTAPGGRFARRDLTYDAGIR